MCHARCYNTSEEKQATYKESGEVRNEKANGTELSWYRILDLIETKSIVNASSYVFTSTVYSFRWCKVLVSIHAFFVKCVYACVLSV